MRRWSPGSRALALIVIAITTGAWTWTLPRGFPQPHVPPDNAMSASRVELGRHLFYDKRLSANATYACASCHRQELAFTDGRASAIGATGEHHPRSAMSLANVAYNASFTWSNAKIDRLEAQARVPMFNEHPIELGVRGHEPEVLDRLRADQRYVAMFANAFPTERAPITIANVTRAIASFERTLLSGRSPYDRVVADGDHDALSPAAWRGMKLFFSNRAHCSECHAGFNFSGPVHYLGGPNAKAAFHDTGLNGRFRAPTLRNVAVTAPYMHDGRFTTLDAVIDHYIAREKLTIASDEKRDLIAFLESLTDEELLHDARFSDPWAIHGQTLPIRGQTLPIRGQTWPTRPMNLPTHLW
ncbi:MAG TPA: cytochrome c peroxidase [Thermoanaerobaculia bacterium]|nr:cytochrome c peroxidase [Thermoanaerobaculia bacterium]